MNTTLVINRKGGAGKTTVSINLASYFATANVATTIMDYDPQGSSLHWLKLRHPTLAKIHGSNAAPEKFGQLRSFGMYVPRKRSFIHATAHDVLLTGLVRTRSIRIGVIANRVRRSMPVYQPLERFLKALNLNLIGRLLDSEAFVRAAETGAGIFEMDPGLADAECRQFAPIIEWVTGEKLELPAASVYQLNLRLGGG